MLNQDQIAIINATVPAVKAHARDITNCFYPLMFARYPEVKRYFNHTNQIQGTQREALANAVIAYAGNIERLEALGEAVSLIAHKHCSLGILPEHYPIVGECLLAAISDVLGDAATEEVLSAWGAAYEQLAAILIGVEETIYEQNQQRLGGWRGERAFRLVDRVEESTLITSYYLHPVDGEPLVSFLPGQYVGVVLHIHGEEIRRNYSLSDAPGKHGIRISVKREPDGVVSNYLHEHFVVGDEIAVTAPCGDFVLDDSQRPLVLLSGGVGITPTMSMLNTCVTSGREIIFIHAALNSQVHAFRDHVAELSARYDNLKSFTIYDQALSGDTPDAKGYLSAELLAQWLPENRDVELYFLGPKPFMQAVSGFVRDLKIPEAQVHYEFFGPLQELHADAVDMAVGQ